MWSFVSGFLDYTPRFQGLPSCSTFQYFILSNSRIFHYMNGYLFIHPLISWWVFALFPLFGYCEECCSEYFSHGYMSSISFLVKTIVFSKERSISHFMPMDGKVFTGRTGREQGMSEEPEEASCSNAPWGPPPRALSWVPWASLMCYWHHGPATQLRVAEGDSAGPPHPRVSKPIIIPWIGKWRGTLSHTLMAFFYYSDLKRFSH